MYLTIIQCRTCLLQRVQEFNFVAMEISLNVCLEDITKHMAVATTP